MKKIPVDSVENGMILDLDVRGSSGNILLNKGTELSVAMGRRLKNWGIFSVFVEGEEELVEEEQSVEISSTEIREQLEIKFADHLDNPMMNELLVAVYNFKCHKSSD